MKISIASDHGGFDLKSQVLEYLKSKNFSVTDEGCFDKSSVNYPDYAKKVCKSILDKKSDMGVLICTTGIGISMTANKFEGIRAALCLNEDMAMMTRLHNNANVLCMGAKYTSIELAQKIIDNFFATEFEGGRHQIRVDNINSHFCE